MTTNRRGSLGVSLNEFSRTGALARRTALLAPLALAGCGLLDEWFGDSEATAAGKRENVIADRAAA